MILLDNDFEFNGRKILFDLILGSDPKGATIAELSKSDCQSITLGKNSHCDDTNLIVWDESHYNDEEDKDGYPSDLTVIGDNTTLGPNNIFVGFSDVGKNNVWGKNNITLRSVTFGDNISVKDNNYFGIIGEIGNDTVIGSKNNIHTNSDYGIGSNNIIGDNNKFGYEELITGANCEIGNNNIFAGLILAKNVKIGSNCRFGRKVNIAKNCIIGDNVIIGNKVSIPPNCTIGDNAIITKKNKLHAGSNIAANTATSRSVKIFLE